VLNQGIAPVWVGEFGTGQDAADASDSVPGSQGQWFSTLTQYLQGHRSMGWSYWALNGEDRYGLLDPSYSWPASSMKQQQLAGIQ
jgi:endoglucanase